MPKKKDSQNNLEKMRHSTAHLLASAVQSMWPNTKFAIGPATEDGFYYDFEFPRKISEEDLPKIEKKMEEIKKLNLVFEQFDLPAKEALDKERQAKQGYKAELVEGLIQQNEKKVSYYKLGKFVDLCRGPHVSSTDQIGHFKLLNIAGAYWRGDSKRQMLTRIYGAVFPTKEELEKHFWQLEEAKKRDHKKLGPHLELFMFHETAPGMPYWLPKGVILYNELINFWRKEHDKRGYQEIVSPLLNKRELYEISGHWEHYIEYMFISETQEAETYGIKPMNCPNAMIVYKSKTHSYRDLPLRLSDIDTLHRKELSGTLNGLFRVREFRQDDAHIFVTEDQIEEEYKKIFEIVELFYSVFNLNYSFRLGTRPEKFMGDTKTWNKAENSLKQILKISKKPFTIAEADGAFYGPKIDILMQDALGRSWQMGTIQLDFQIPQKFALTYTDSDGKEKTPIAIHRVIYGSLERFIGILIEHYTGNFPVWLSPVQVAILPITAENVNYARQIHKVLTEEGIRSQLDNRNETLQAKIRDAQLQKIPYMLVIGNKEERKKTVTLRLRTGEDKGELTQDEFTKHIKNIIQSKKEI